MSRATAQMQMQKQRTFEPKPATTPVDEPPEDHWANLDQSGEDEKAPCVQPVAREPAKVYRPQRLRLDDPDLGPLCIHCACETRRRCDGGCGMPYCSQLCQSEGKEYHRNYCGKRIY